MIQAQLTLSKKNLSNESGLFLQGKFVKFLQNYDLKCKLKSVDICGHGNKFVGRLTTLKFSSNDTKPFCARVRRKP